MGNGHFTVNVSVLDEAAHTLTVGKADAALAASLFHYRELEIGELKRYLSSRGLPMRITDPEGTAPVYTADQGEERHHGGDQQ